MNKKDFSLENLVKRAERLFGPFSNIESFTQENALDQLSRQNRR